MNYYDLSRRIETQKKEFMQMTDRVRVPLLREGQENETI